MKIIVQIQHQNPTNGKYSQIERIYKLWVEDLKFTTYDAMRQIGEVLKDDYQS